MKRIYTVNEWTLSGFLFDALIGRNPSVLSVEANLPPLQGILQRISDRVVAKGRASNLIDETPTLHRIRDYSAAIMFYDIFGETEAWHNDHFRFIEVDAAIADYARAFKLITCNYMMQKQLSVLLLAEAEKLVGADGCKVRGVSADTLGLFEAYFGRRSSFDIRVMQSPRFIVNGVCAVVLTGYAILWALLRLKLLGVKPENTFLAYDNVPSERNMYFLREMQDGGPLLAVHRSAKIRPDEDWGSLTDVRTCVPEDGAFGPGETIRAIVLAMGDGLEILRIFGNMSVALYFQIALLPYRRIVIRALLNRFQPKYYWARDPYNPEHILRRQELHRIGSQMHGILSGCALYANIEPPLRYLSYDRYYVFGSAWSENYMKDTWAQDMRVVPVGSFNCTREENFQLKERRKKGLRDIVVFSGISAFEQNSALIDVVRRLGQSFPDRTVWLQVKPYFRSSDKSNSFVNACSKGLANVVYSSESLFDLFEKSEYAFSDPSTVLMESIQFGLKGFVVDTIAGHKKCLYRDFPSICLKTADEAETWIKEIESGKRHYMREELNGLIDLSGTVVFDVIRSGLGLHNSHDEQSSKLAS